MAKKINFDKKYLCHAATPKVYLSYGACGEIHSLKKWLEDCFPNHKYPFEEFFNGYSEKEVVDYIYVNAGLRLTKDISKYL